MFKVKQNICPTVLSNLFLENKNVHDYYTRQADQFHIPVAKRNYMQKTRMWNMISSPATPTVCLEQKSENFQSRNVTLSMPSPSQK